MDNMEKYTDSFVQKWHSVYFFIPVFEKMIEMPTLETFLSALSRRFGKVEPMAKKPQMPTKGSDLLGFALCEHLSFYENGEKQIPSQLILYGPDAFNDDIWDEQIISQFWDCEPTPKEFSDRCHYSFMCSNMMAAELPIMEQYQIMADYADLMLELFPDCIGIYWPHSQSMTPRGVFQESHWTSGELHFLDGGLHVRFFNISGTDEMVFDTLGFTAIGLPDLQCHCIGLETDDVILFLQNLASYLYENGDVIEDGDTIDGIDSSRWCCQREDSMVKPKRVVLDICPGKYAGGGRVSEES